MKKFKKQQIDGTRDYFRKKGYEEVPVTLGNRNFSYFILPQKLGPKDFVFRCTGQSSDGYVFGISDSVDAKYRPYSVAHEFIEFTEMGIETPDRCVKALEEELKLVPKKIKSGYLKMREPFFRNLIKIASSQPEDYSKEDLKEFRQSLERLQQIID